MILNCLDASNAKLSESMWQLHWFVVVEGTVFVCPPYCQKLLPAFSPALRCQLLILQRTISMTISSIGMTMTSTIPNEVPAFRATYSSSPANDTPEVGEWARKDTQIRQTRNRGRGGGGGLLNSKHWCRWYSKSRFSGRLGTALDRQKPGIAIAVLLFVCLVLEKSCYQSVNIIRPHNNTRTSC